ncbi:MAG: reverse transcriptase domain-containing protein, partial [Cyanobacteria bacterium J06614_10]
YAKVKYKSSFSDEWSINSGVRQGGVLSGILFNLYIDSLLDRISAKGIGCKLGLFSSNIVAYADDVVLMAPSALSLQLLINETVDEISKLCLKFNSGKTKIMIFRSDGRNYDNSKINFEIDNCKIEIVNSLKYLGYNLMNNMCNIEDMNRVKQKFYAEFNSVLRHFNFADTKIKLFLFKQYCLQMYGSELWFGGKSEQYVIRQFAIGYHKAIKKLLGLSMHESNHYACQEASLLMFNHMINNNKLHFIFRIFYKPCSFIDKLIDFLYVSSFMLSELKTIFRDIYDVENVLDNDLQALTARISYVQNHEKQMREQVILET